MGNAEGANVNTNTRRAVYCLIRQQLCVNVHVIAGRLHVKVKVKVKAEDDDDDDDDNDDNEKGSRLRNAANPISAAGHCTRTRKSPSSHSHVLHTCPNVVSCPASGKLPVGFLLQPKKQIRTVAE